MMTDERLRPLGSTRDWGSQMLLLRGLTGSVRFGQWGLMDQKIMMFKGRVCFASVQVLSETTDNRYQETSLSLFLTFSGQEEIITLAFSSIL